MSTNSDGQKDKLLTWWQLSLLGVASTIGTGFFLGSSIAITFAGPAVLFVFILAAIGTYFVFEALAKMTIADPQKGSFRTYAKKAYGRWAGFSSGWVYWLSEMLIIGSQLIALSIFSQFWFSTIPIWVFSSGYAVLGLIVIMAGNKGFDRVENLLAVLKIAAILMFIILAIAALFGILGKGTEAVSLPRTYDTFFPEGFTGLLPALIYGFYGFGGIEIMGLLAVRLKNMDDAPKSGKFMLFLLTIIYVTSIGLALLMVPFKSFSIEQSPFVTALTNFQIPYVSHFFHGVFIIAGFSTMVASMFAVIQILVTLAEDHDAPSFFATKLFKKLELPAIGLTTAGIIVSIIFALLMPGKIYEYVTTAAGIMLLYNWLIILGSYGKLIELTTKDQIKRFTGIVLIVLAIGGTIFHQTSRPGFFISILFIVVIGIITLIVSRSRKKGDDNQIQTSLFTRIKR